MARKQIKEEDQQDFHKDDYIRLKKWLHRKHPEVIDEYEENIEGVVIHT